MTPPQSLLSVLRRQHAHIEAMTSRVLDVEGPARREAVVDLLRYLALHESAEQTFMRPPWLTSSGGTAAARARVAQEREIEAVIVNLETVHPESVDFLIYFGLLEEALRSHTRVEEEVEVPILGGCLPPHEVERIAQQVGLVDAWMDPAMHSIDGSVARLPWTVGPHQNVRYGELRQKSLEAFEAVARMR